MAKDAYYFSHDSNARNDIKIMKLRRVHGMAGYGVYWAIIEMLRDAEGYALPVNHIEEISYDLRVEPELTYSIIGDFELFETDGELFWSSSLKRRMIPLDELREKRREAGRKGGKKSGIARAKAKQNEARLKQTSSKTNLSKVNKSKVKETKGEGTRTREEVTPTDLIKSIRNFESFRLAEARAKQDGINFDDECTKWAGHVFKKGEQDLPPSRLAPWLHSWIINDKRFKHNGHTKTNQHPAGEYDSGGSDHSTAKGLHEV